MQKTLEVRGLTLFECPPHVVFLLYLLNSLFLGAEIFRLFKFYGESFGIQFEFVRFRSLP